MVSWSEPRSLQAKEEKVAKAERSAQARTRELHRADLPRQVFR
jgi:hypothetical protein